jgi:hypothetical protein
MYLRSRIKRRNHGLSLAEVVIKRNRAKWDRVCANTFSPVAPIPLSQ